MDQEREAASWKKFFVHKAGETLGAHEDWISKFQSIGQSEVKSPEESDYILLFCPIASRVGTDINAALEKAPGKGLIILIVMHHTFNPNCITADIEGLVENRNRVVLVVDCLFYKERLLNSSANDRAWSEVKRFLEDPKEVSLQSRFINPHRHDIQTHENAAQPGPLQTERDTTEGTVDKNHQLISDPNQEKAPGSWKKFYVHLMGETLGAHKDWVTKFKRIGQSKVKSLKKCDYILLFCPIMTMTEVETDMGKALENTTGEKKIILIVINLTFNPDHITADSKRLMKDTDRIVLVVDCLLHDQRLQNSSSNDRAWSEIKRFFGDPKEIQSSFCSCLINWFKKKPWTSLGIGISTVAVVILAVVLYQDLHKHKQ